MQPPLVSWESLVPVGLLLLAFLWAARPVQNLRMTLDLRAFRPDVWKAMLLRRGEPVWLDIIDRYEFDDGSDHDGVMVFRTGMRIRFETYGIATDGKIWTAAWRSVEIAPDGSPSGDPYETLMTLAETPEGVSMELRYTFYKGDAGGWKVWLARLVRPLTRIQARPLILGALEKSGALERYRREHGEPPAPPILAGVPMTRWSLLLFGLGSASFIWQFGFWAGVALLAILVLHELGHVFAMRAGGDRSSAFYLLPFLGGVAVGRKRLASDRALVLMVLAGPAAGLLSALGAMALYHLTDIDWFAAVALLAAAVNLFNLLPIPILDGGQVLMALLRPYLPAAAIRWLGVTLMVAGAVVAAVFGSVLLMVILGLLAALQAAFPAPEMPDGARPLDRMETVATAAALVGLALALALVLRLVLTGEGYPASPLRLIGEGPFF